MTYFRSCAAVVPSNWSMDTHVLSAGFAGLPSAGHLQLQGLPHLSSK
jgi:hypothetical protein